MVRTKLLILEARGGMEKSTDLIIFFRAGAEAEDVLEVYLAAEGELETLSRLKKLALICQAKQCQS